MHTKLRRTVFALALVAAMALAAPAVARRDHSGRHGAQPRNPVVSYVLKGKVDAVDVDGEVVTVAVERSNRHGRRMRGQDVQFDVSDARVVVRDRNGDGVRNLADVSVGDVAVVKARLPKRLAADATQPFEAKKLIAKAAPPPEEA
jgi:hypothetical protein